MKTPDDTSSVETLEQEAYGWVVRFISGDAAPDDIEALKEWSAQSAAHAAAFDQASKVWRATGAATRKLSTAISLGIRRNAPPSAVSPGRIDLSRRAVVGGALVASAAAGLAFVAVHPPLGLWPSWFELAADYRTGTGQQRQITLPGDVAIDMNTQTSIALRSKGNPGDGIELIAGEAVISASSTAASPFTVVAADGRVMATDARFNVRRDGRLVCITCVNGEVRVEYGPAQLELPAGRQVTYSDQGFEQQAAINPATVTAWQDGIVIFDSTPVSKVVEEVNRYRAGRVILTSAALGRERFSARFRIANIDGVVEQIARRFSVRGPRALPGGIVLLG
jgi:transmembrane sensor